ncbi:MAG: PilN domain-containing protein, partial [Thiobacillus sp.]|nr:PilN domain-containing protein [Thiobacillus sp.]
QVLNQLALPWDRLFSAVEESSGADVALLVMEPDTLKGLVRIGGEAKHLDAALAFVKQLGAHPIFTRVALQNHQVQQQDPQKPVRFSLVAAWSEAQP